MASVMKTPGAYIVEKDAFPNPVVEVATGVPAFIGYTADVDDNGKSLLNKPRRITSMMEFENLYGGPPALAFTLGTAAAAVGESVPVLPGPPGPVGIAKGGASYFLSRTRKPFHLYYCMKSFFMNGGGLCYVVSVGPYDYDAPMDAQAFRDAIDVFNKEQEPTMVVVPDSVLLSRADHASVATAAISHCAKMMSRIAIVDVHKGYEERTNVGETDCVMKFRDDIGVNDLKWATAYYPWIDTSIVEARELSYELLDADGRRQLVEMLQGMLGIADAPTTPAEAKQKELIDKIVDPATDPADGDGAAVAKKKATERELLDNDLRTVPPYRELLRAMQGQINLLPPAATMAGIFSKVDEKRGVWNAPANVSLQGVVRPHVNITHEEQEDLNTPLTGKAVNAIRSSVEMGTLVWGARTLDGNSLDWRYIHVRRFMIMIEQSIKIATKAYVFEANEANTWVTLKSMIREFLAALWKRGGLAGASPDDAFSIHVGLGETMTPEDILEGVLRVTVLVAPTRPAEFIELTFQQQMQRS